MPTIYHFAARYPEIYGKKSMLMLAKAPEQKLIVFVHGFGGSPLTTWSRFHTYLTTDAEMMGYDLFFYHYDSKKIQAFVSGINLDKILEEILDDPNYFSSYYSRPGNINYGKRPTTFRYKEFYFVAHSFGAIVMRRAMLFALENNHQWAEISKMMLFAPAHNGARAIQAIQRMLSIIPFYIGYKRYRTPTLDDVDLDSANCTLLKLKEETRTAQLSSAGNCTIAGKTIFAGEELVVNNDKYLKDRQAIVENGKNHGHVCKPTSSYLLPVTELKGFLLSHGA
jgi:pimeloyl-ACP methyl ester carboxylesterase